MQLSDKDLLSQSDLIAMKKRILWFGDLISIHRVCKLEYLFTRIYDAKIRDDISKYSLWHR